MLDDARFAEGLILFVSTFVIFSRRLQTFGEPLQLFVYFQARLLLFASTLVGFFQAYCT